jgi:hypothetical protein
MGEVADPLPFHCRRRQDRNFALKNVDATALAIGRSGRFDALVRNTLERRATVEVSVDGVPEGFIVSGGSREQKRSLLWVSRRLKWMHRRGAR